MHIHILSSIDEVSELKQQYFRETTAPLDGMWLCGFVPMATHYGIYDQQRLVGFYCVNDEGYVLQFFVIKDVQEQSSQIFTSIFNTDSASPGHAIGAFVSTAEPTYLSLCLDHFTSFKVNALMYQQDQTPINQRSQDTLSLTPIELQQLQEAVEFAVAAIGAPSEWLSGYFTNLISRQELFGVWSEGRLIATGESRGYDEYQVGYADLGVIVTESERGKGLATNVIRQLVAMNDANALKSICSTESSNVAAQTAITRAGFFAGNRILQFHG